MGRGHVFPWANAFVGQGQSQFEAPVRGQDAKEGEVKRSRAVLGHGQEVKALFWAVKDLDRGRKCLNRLYGSDTPL